MWWFQRCGNDHPHCTPVDYPGRKLPKRLLEVGNSSNGLTVKLIETQPVQDINYMTLSHCWGGTLPISLLTGNLEIFKAGIPFTSLPKTFQDALSVVGWFEIKHLWIDALCIIQDSDNDWAHESGCMRDYYKYSFGTVAATGASRSSEGLFFDRNPAFVPPFRAIRRWYGRATDVVVTAAGGCLEELREEPLNQRGWFLQERFLSPRILHFGRDHVSWECRTWLSCETWPNIVPSSIYSDSSFPLTDRGTSISWNLHDISSIRALWRKIVSTYSRMALTRLSDRCVAFAGIAEDFQAITRDDYVAGLWRRDLVEELLWEVDTSQYPKDSPARAQSYLAPSWSWLSLDRAVRLQDIMRPGSDRMTVISVRVESVTENRFGAVKNGGISARGLLVPAICTADNGSWCFHSISFAKVSKDISALYIDEGHIEEPDRSLYCLPVLDDYGYVRGLLVVPTNKMTAQYRRIGTFAIQKPHGYDFLGIPRASDDGWEGPEYHNFTLV